jgi:hypothetical protein
MCGPQSGIGSAGPDEAGFHRGLGRARGQPRRIGALSVSHIECSQPTRAATADRLEFPNAEAADFTSFTAKNQKNEREGEGQSRSRLYATDDIRDSQDIKGPEWLISALEWLLNGAKLFRHAATVRSILLTNPFQYLLCQNDRIFYARIFESESRFGEVTKSRSFVPFPFASLRVMVVRMTTYCHWVVISG